MRDLRCLLGRHGWRELVGAIDDEGQELESGVDVCQRSDCHGERVDMLMLAFLKMELTASTVTLDGFGRPHSSGQPYARMTPEFSAWVGAHSRPDTQTGDAALGFTSAELEQAVIPKR